MSILNLSQEELVIASHNAGKVREISALLQPYVGSFTSAADLNLPEPEETEDSFCGNALLKARAACGASGRVSLADDSGLCVNALGGDPGIYSARWAGPDKDFQMAMQKINDLLADNPDRSAYFVCVLALVFPNGSEHVFEGRVGGDLCWPPRGEYGFGYDPFFVAAGMDTSFAEIDPVRKHAISHRAQAFESLKESLLL